LTIATRRLLLFSLLARPKTEAQRRTSEELKNADAKGEHHGRPA
jgi:hypothetical protein